MSSIADTRAMMRPEYESALAAPPDLGAVDAGGGLGAGDAWRVLKQRKVLIAVSFVIIYALIGAATFVVYRFFPAYPSEAYLEMAPPRPAVGIDDQPVRPEEMKQQLETEARKLKQLSLLREVLEAPEIKQTSYYQWYGDFQECLFDLQDMVNSVPVPDTNLIRISFAWRNREDAKKIVAKIVDRYLSTYSDKATAAYREIKDSLSNTLSRFNIELQNQRKKISEYRESANIPQLTGERDSTVQNIGYLKTQLSDMSTESADYEQQLRTVEGVETRRLPVTPEMRILVEADPVLRYWRSQVEAMDIDINALLQTGMIGAKHRQMELLKARRLGYVEKETARREELLDDLRERQVEFLRQNMQRLLTMQARVQEELDSAQAKQRDLDRGLQQYELMQKDEENLVEQIKQFDLKLKEAEHVLNDRTRVRLSLVQAPELAVKPSRPDLPLYLGGGFVVALLAAVGLAFLREFTDKAIRTPQDVARHGRLSVLGSVPLLDEEEADVETIETATRRAPHSLVAEAFRQVRTNLLFSGPAEMQRSLLVTSPGSEDGKTAVAINLAVTLACSNQKVLLVDCNFRRPALRNAFANTRYEGLSNILIGQAKLQDMVTKTDLPNLDVLTTGPMPPTPAELLGSPFMRELIKEATQKYDRVVFDGPPVLLFSDALMIAAQVDGVVLVARAVNNSKGILKRAREQLERVNARVLGAILNGVEARPGGYFREQYREFYDYAAGDATVPPELPAAPQPPTQRLDDDEEQEQR